MKLPAVLAGPVLRRCDEQSVAIWLCTSQPLHLSAEIRQQSAGPTPNKLLGTGESIREVRLGENLYVQIVLVKPTHSVGARFPVDVVLSYDLLLGSGRRGAKAASLFDSHVERSAVCLAGSRLPSLVLHSESAPNLRSHFGSCRKMSGTGRDATQLLVDRLEDKGRSPGKRPNCLLLVGDQIYGDDVSRHVFPAIGELAKAIGGSWSVAPLSDYDSRYAAVGSRSKLVSIEFESNKTGFSVNSDDDGANHLLTEYEYMSAYLLAWSPNLWADPLALVSQLKAARESGQQRTLRGSNLQRELSELDDFLLGAASLRKVMANTPTYMLFDDHDVTDDWNYDVEWRANLPALGKSVVASALVASVAFQAWGNRDDPKADQLISIVERHYAERQRIQTTTDRYLKLMRDLELGLTAIDWSFVTPTRPRVVFVDTRTKRERSDVDVVATCTSDLGEVHRTPPLNSLLLSKAAIAQVEAKFDPAKDPCLVIATPTPVFSHFAVEDAKNIPNLWLRSRKTRLKSDLEDWRSNPESFLRMIDLVFSLKKKTCLILSGDVHYSYSLRARVRRGADQVEVLQLCSSPFKNEAPKVFQGLLNGIDLRTTETTVWWWKPGDKLVGMLSDPDRSPGLLAFMKAKHGEPHYRTDVDLLPHNWLPSRVSANSLEFSNAIGSVVVSSRSIEAFHVSRKGGRIVESRPAKLEYATLAR